MDPDQSRQRSARPGSSLHPQLRQMIEMPIQRPITQHGISGMRPIQTARVGAGRMYKDQRYYQALVQAHMQTIRNEMYDLQKNTSQCRSASSALFDMKRVAKDQANIFKESREKLSDVNVIVEVYSTSPDRGQKLSFKASTIKEKNKQLNNEFAEIYQRDKTDEELYKSLHKEYTEIVERRERILSVLSNSERIKFQEIVTENIASRKKIAEKKETITFYQTYISENQLRLKRLQDQTSQLVKRSRKYKRYQNIMKIKGLKKKKKKIQKYIKELPPAYERHRIVLEKFKLVKKEFINAKKKYDVMIDELVKKEHKLDVLEAYLEEGNAHRIRKHRELRKKEIMLNEFFETYPQKYKKLQLRLKSNGQFMCVLLDRICNHVPQVLLYDNKEIDFYGLNIDTLRSHIAALDLKILKIFSYKSKFQSDLDKKKDKCLKMKFKIETISNPEMAKKDILDEVELLQGKCNYLEQTLKTTKDAIVEAENKKTKVQAQLHDNVLYKEIINLELELKKVQRDIQNIQITINYTTATIKSIAIVEEIHALAIKRNDQLLLAAGKIKRKPKPQPLTFMRDPFDVFYLEGNKIGRKKVSRVD